MTILDEFDDGSVAYRPGATQHRKHPCAGKTARGKSCRRRAAISADGRWYCWDHAPEGARFAERPAAQRGA